ncbi:hypothetical protein EV426DRAFT_558636 [Tirmania nivea]|nr:hypothetical protein EV426DRAFT_558636 [Tirmania nivea]
MYFLTGLTTLLALGASIVTAAPTAIANDASFEIVARSAEDIFAKCKDAGVDPYGKIPEDWREYNKTTNIYFFDAGSKAALWAAAQVYTDEHKHEKRQGPANIGIGMWAQDGCSGAGVWVDNVNYNVNYYSTTNLYSVLIKYRGLRSNEHLDFSRLSGSDWCGQYLYSAGQNTPAGCFNSQLINCFRLWI